MKGFTDSGGKGGCWFLRSMVNSESWSLCIESCDHVKVHWCWFIAVLVFHVCLLICAHFTHNTLCRTVTLLSSKSYERIEAKDWDVLL